LNEALGIVSPALFLLPYLLATDFQPSTNDLIRVVGYLALPTTLLHLRSKKAKPFDPLQVLTILALWVPLEPDLFILFLDLLLPGLNLRSSIPDPTLLPVRATLLPGVDLPLMSLMAISLALYLFTVRHPLKDLEFTIHLGWRDVRSALLGLSVYALVGVPLGLVIGFLEFEPHVPDGGELLAGILAGYLLVALIEEVLFRGIIQNLLSKRLRRPWVGLGVSAFIFGLAHLNNSTPGFPVPNWGYVLMATLAGLAYGWVWMRTGKVTASAITHMLVNLVWGIVLS
jgi:hypothetical protein